MGNELDTTISRQIPVHEVPHDAETLQRVAGALGRMDLSARAGVVEYKPFVPRNIEPQHATSQIFNQRREAIHQ